MAPSANEHPDHCFKEVKFGEIFTQVAVLENKQSNAVERQEEFLSKLHNLENVLKDLERTYSQRFIDTQGSVSGSVALMKQYYEHLKGVINQVTQLNEEMASMVTSSKLMESDLRNWAGRMATCQEKCAKDFEKIFRHLGKLDKFYKICAVLGASATVLGGFVGFIKIVPWLAKVLVMTFGA